MVVVVCIVLRATIMITKMAGSHLLCRISLSFLVCLRFLQICIWNKVDEIRVGARVNVSMVMVTQIMVEKC